MIQLDYKSPSQNKHAIISPHQSQELFTIVQWLFECNGDIFKFFTIFTCKQKSRVNIHWYIYAQTKLNPRRLKLSFKTGITRMQRKNISLQVSFNVTVHTIGCSFFRCIASPSHRWGCPGSLHDHCFPDNRIFHALVYNWRSLCVH